MAGKQRSITRSIPAPVGGWNVRDAYAEMSPTDAVIMDNWWPTTVDCVIRKGYTVQASGIPGTVETIFAYNTVTGAKKLFAFNSLGALYDITTPGAVGAAVLSGRTNGRWQYVLFTTIAGNYLLAVNGVDDMLRYDGTTWTTVTGAITGVATNTIVNINVFKKRIWMIQRNSLSAWYLPTDAIAGAATEFPMGSQFSEGGYLVAMATWTMEGGVGLDDQAAFFSSEGEIVVYKGTDPASAATFALVGVFKQGNPIGYRCQIKYLGDVYVITNQGVVPLSKSILTAQVTNKSSLSDKIQPAMADAVALGSTSFGWQMVPYPSVNMLVVNVPSSLGNYQFAMNTITGAWTKFTGWAASCWEGQGESIYYGGAGFVAAAWSTNFDNGISIQAAALPAFNSFGRDSQTKIMHLVRPIISSSGSPSFLFGINYDYDITTQPSGELSFAAPTGMVWGSMVWGSMVWGGSLVTQRGWQFASGTGYSASMYIKAQNNGAEVHWAETSYVFESGGVL